MASFFDTIDSYMTDGIILDHQDASGNLVDRSGNGHSGVVSGTALSYRSATGPAGAPYGITYASGSLVTVTDHADLDLGNSTWSIGILVKRTAAATDYNFLQKSGAYSLAITGDLWRLRDGAGLTNIRSASTVDTTTYHLIIATRGAAADGKVFFDGTDVTVASNSVTYSDTANNLVLGTDFVGTCYGAFIMKGVQLDATAVTAIYGAIGNADAVPGVSSASVESRRRRLR